MNPKMNRSASKKSLIKGLSILDQLWKKGLLPEDLERHYYLHWFIAYDGNIVQACKSLGLHRNTVQGHFLKYGLSKKTVRMRYAWKKLDEASAREPFEKKFKEFYDKFSSGEVFTPEENAGLVGLWKSGFPLKTLTPHFFLWAIRAGKTREWAMKTSGYTYRHRARILSRVLSPKSRDSIWLSPLKPTRKEIYSPRYRNVLAKSKKR